MVTGALDNGQTLLAAPKPSFPRNNTESILTLFDRIGVAVSKKSRHRVKGNF